MHERIIITFDIGGTNMRAATISITADKWKILDKTNLKTPNYLLNNNHSTIDLLDTVLGFITDYTLNTKKDFNIDAVVTAFPGPVKDDSIVMALPTMWGTDGMDLCPLDLRENLSKRIVDIPVYVMNDVSAAGYRFTSEYQNFAIFTLGSGIGLKVFINGTPIVGPNGMGGELGHMVFDSSNNAPMCDCGGQGHLSSLSSGRAWEQAVLKAEKLGVEVDILSFTEPLARAIAMIHYSIGIEDFIFAGGLVDYLGESLRSNIVKNLYNQGWNLNQNWDAMVKIAPDDDLSALVGAALSLSVKEE